ncbi:hypothetical protein FS749_012973 [Ceratobasidium sp. UAMH 11750]|nr:hypothetical protein FS749_012973 [Ceratobasidium sp. UAMH 11750]
MSPIGSVLTRTGITRSCSPSVLGCTLTLPPPSYNQQAVHLPAEFDEPAFDDDELKPTSTLALLPQPTQPVLPPYKHHHPKTLHVGISVQAAFAGSTPQPDTACIAPQLALNTTAWPQHQPALTLGTSCAPRCSLSRHSCPNFDSPSRKMLQEPDPEAIFCTLQPYKSARRLDCYLLTQPPSPHLLFDPGPRFYPTSSHTKHELTQIKADTGCIYQP